MPVPWFDGSVTITVEAAFSAATGSYGAWDGGRWDSALWGPDIIWSDISAYVRSIRTDRKCATAVRNWDSGQASIVLSNRDGRFSPDNTTGPYAAAGVSGVRPWRPIRFRVTRSGITYPAWAGYITDVVDTWLPGHVDAYVTLSCVDEWGALSDVDGLTQASQGGGELSGLRVHRILNSAGHTGPRSVMSGRATMQATDLSSNTTQALQLVTDSEGGGIFVDGDGTVVFEDMYALIEQARSNTVQANFDDGAFGGLPCVDVTPEYAGTIKNIISYAQAASLGTPQTVADSTSRALYRDKRLTRTDLICDNDPQCLSLAKLDLETYRQPKKHFRAIEVRPRMSAALWPQAVGRRIRDLVQVTARPMGGPTITRYCHIAGVHHDIGRDDWVTTFDLWDATLSVTYSESRWDVGRWDDSDASWFF